MKHLHRTCHRVAFIIAILFSYLVSLSFSAYFRRLHSVSRHNEPRIHPLVVGKVSPYRFLPSRQFRRVRYISLAICFHIVPIHGLIRRLVSSDLRFRPETQRRGAIDRDHSTKHARVQHYYRE
jgi:hypothetical protein